MEEKIGRNASRMVHISGCLFAWQAVLWKFGSKFGRGKSEGTLAASGQTYLPFATSVLFSRELFGELMSQTTRSHRGGSHPHRLLGTFFRGARRTRCGSR